MEKNHSSFEITQRYERYFKIATSNLVFSSSALTYLLLTNHYPDSYYLHFGLFTYWALSIVAFKTSVEYCSLKEKEIWAIEKRRRFAENNYAVPFINGSNRRKLLRQWTCDLVDYQRSINEDIQVVEPQ